MYLEIYGNFVEIVESGTISAAAKKLHIAQPALSNQIKSLEEKYGTKLLDRGSRRVTLTRAGEILYQNAKTMCKLEEETFGEIRDFLSGSAGTLKFGSIGTQPEKLSASLLLGFHAENPTVTYRVFEGSSVGIIGMLKDGVIDIGIFRSSEPLPECLSPIYSTPARFYVYFSNRNKEFFAYRGKELPVAALKRTPICVANGIRRKFVAMCVSLGFAPNIIGVCDTVATSKIWATTEDTVAIASSISPEESLGMGYCALAEPGFSTTHYICVNKERAISAVCQKFIDYCRKIEFDHTPSERVFDDR